MSFFRIDQKSKEPFEAVFKIIIERLRIEKILDWLESTLNKVKR